MSLNLCTPRRARMALFEDSAHRDVAFATIGDKYVNVLVQKVEGNAKALLVSLTGSFHYDSLVKKAIEDMGGSWMPAIEWPASCCQYGNLAPMYSLQSPARCICILAGDFSTPKRLISIF